MENYKEKDKKAIIDFITNKGVTDVEDIIAHSGADSLRVYPIIAELHVDGMLEIVEHVGLGAPKSVKLK